MSHRKALEPLIASILLIVVVVILVTFVLSFGSDFTNKSLTKTDVLLDSSKEAVSGLFYLNEVNGNYLQLTNLSKEDYNFTGYTILSTDYNSDYFWINSYRPFETNISFKSGSKAFFPLLCMPASKFKLELQDISGNRYTTDISSISNSGYTSCNQYHVPLWEFETVSGSYTINTFSKQEGELANISWGNIPPYTQLNITDNFYVRATHNADISTAYFYRIHKLNMFQEGRKYKIVFNIRGNGTIVNKNLRLRLGLMGERYTISTINISSDFVQYEVILNVGDLLVTYSNALNFEPTAVLQSGDWYEIKDLSVVEIEPLPTITTGTKYLENTIAGISSISSSQAYGTWEFDWFVPSTSMNRGRVIIMSDISDIYPNINAYIFDVGNSNNIRLSRISSTPSFNQIIVGATDSVVANVWYRIKITRHKNGFFYLYIKGNNYGNNWVLIGTIFDTIYMTGNYFRLNFNNGNRIANIKITPEIE